MPNDPTTAAGKWAEQAGGVSCTRYVLEAAKAAAPESIPSRAPSTNSDKDFAFFHSKAPGVLPLGRVLLDMALLVPWGEYLHRVRTARYF